MFLHLYLSARSVAQLVEHLSCKQKPEFKSRPLLHFLSRGNWHTPVIQLLGCSEVEVEEMSVSMTDFV